MADGFQPTILIVDDDEPTLVAMKALLAPLGAHVIEARSGGEALDQLLAHAIDVAVLDVRMPDMDGFELAETMRSSPRTRDIPILFVTGNQEVSREFEGYEVGAVDYLVKPVDPLILRSKASVFVELTARKRELVRRVEELESALAAERLARAEAQRAEAARRESEDALRRSEEALRDLNQQLLEADRRKNEFLAVLSHELRNPLAPIRNSVYVLERATPGGEQANRARQVIERQVQHMARLIDDLLDLTRITRGKITLQRERLDVNALARRTAEDHREAFRRNGVALEVTGPDEPLWVEGDPTRLAQVIGNLLANSAKFTTRGGKTAVSLDADRSSAVVRVRDDGAGLSPETRERLFEPFVQAAQPLDRTRGGLGLGLALVKALVEMHRGTVTATSEGEGKGSEFTVRIPLCAPARRGNAALPPPRRAPRARRVLVIEDNLDAAESLREALELGTHHVVVAHSGPEGIAAARRHRPDVVLCDLGLPGLDGYGVARALRSDPALRGTFLVALSGYALQEDVARSSQAGFDRHVAKPPSMEAIESLLEEAPGG